MPDLPERPFDRDTFAPKALAVWEVLETRFGQHLAPDEIDHLFARFVFGLTSPLHGDDDPRNHLHICRAVLGLKLSPERTEGALHSVPQASSEWVASAFDTIEILGLKDGHALYDLLNAKKQRRENKKSPSPDR